MSADEKRRMITEIEEARTKVAKDALKLLEDSL